MAAMIGAWPCLGLKDAYISHSLDDFGRALLAVLFNTQT
jgi:hypothetical protein